jgi:hypothetical protein
MTDTTTNERLKQIGRRFVYLYSTRLREKIQKAGEEAVREFMKEAARNEGDNVLRITETIEAKQKVSI